MRGARSDLFWCNVNACKWCFSKVNNPRARTAGFNESVECAFCNLIHHNAPQKYWKWHVKPVILHSYMNLTCIVIYILHFGLNYVLAFSKCWHKWSMCWIKDDTFIQHKMIKNLNVKKYLWNLNDQFFFLWKYIY